VFVHTSRHIESEIEVASILLSKHLVAVSWVANSSGDTLCHFRPSWWCPGYIKPQYT